MKYTEVRRGEMLDGISRLTDSTSAAVTAQAGDAAGRSSLQNLIRHPSPDSTMTVSGEDLTRYLAWLARKRAKPRPARRRPEHETL
jgi:hypothetical protein